MKIYHYVTGILNPTKEDLYNVPLKLWDYDTGACDDDEEDENINYKRRVVTFVFEQNFTNFLKGINMTANNWIKLKNTYEKNNNMMSYISYDTIIQRETTDGQITERWKNISEDDFQEFVSLYALFKPVDMGVIVNCNVEKKFPKASTEEKIGYMCAAEYDTFICIENELRLLQQGVRYH